MELLDRADGLAQMLEHVVHPHLGEPVIGERPRIGVEVVDDVHARQLGEIMVDPARQDLVPAAQMEALPGQRRRS